MKKYTIKNVFKRIVRIPKRTICLIRSIYFTLMINEGGGRITLSDPFIRFVLKKHPSSKLIIKGNLRITRHFYGSGKVVIKMDANSQLIINGDFVIGQGVRIIVSKNALLSFGGRQKESFRNHIRCFNYGFS